MSTNVQHVGMSDASVAAPDPAQGREGVCTVLHCAEEAGSLPWPTENASGGWPIMWAVCRYHYWQLDSGKAFTKVNEDEPRTNRWLLMNADVVESVVPLTQPTRISVSA